jgi:hypothetical protein
MVSRFDTIEVQFSQACGFKLHSPYAAPWFEYQGEAIVCAQLLLPAYLHKVVEMAKNHLCSESVRINIHKYHANHYELKLVCYQSDSQERVITVEGKGPSALNLAYMRAVVALHFQLVLV